MEFQLESLQPEGITLRLIESDFEVDKQKSREFHLNVDAPYSAFEDGKATLKLKVTNQLEQEQEATFRLLGPKSDPNQ